MTTITRESDMRPAIIDWLNARRCKVLHECVAMGNCDVVGVRFAERHGRRIPPLENLITIELKMRDVAGVIRQAEKHVGVANGSFAAMPLERCQRMRDSTRERFWQAGVGLLAVDAWGARVIVLAAERCPLQMRRRLQKAFWRRLREIA